MFILYLIISALVYLGGLPPACFCFFMLSSPYFIVFCFTSFILIVFLSLI
nr:MAG TPA: hypothetical protein [Caudoviricetes sp.]